MSTVVQQLPSISSRRPSMNLPPIPISPTNRHPSIDENSESSQTPISKDFTMMRETTDVDRSRNKFGSKAKIIRRMSSTEWENPKTADNVKFAQIDDGDEKFQAKIDLNCFPNFDVDEIDINVYGYDVLVHARKDHPSNPNLALMEISRQYRLPDDVDLDTIKLRKNKLKREVSVDAEKTHGYGKPVSFAVFDVTQHDPNVKFV
uniref:SHSP domain-containing protein n=1 Tax=Panagrolaimus sp. JU765 TaxID=591449 RepID=A0AC34QF58_9BILA